MSNEITKTLNEVFADTIRKWITTYSNLTDIHLITVPEKEVGKVKLHRIIEDIRKNRLEDEFTHTSAAAMFNPRTAYNESEVENMLKYLIKNRVAILGYEFITNKTAKLTRSSPKEIGLWIIATEEFKYLRSPQVTVAVVED